MSLNNRNDSILYIERKGTHDSPLSDITERIKIAFNKALLKENPNKFDKPVITDSETGNRYYEVQNMDEIKEGNHFFVDYRNGVIHFHSLANGKSVDIKYKGKGVLLYPASRIYLNGDIEGSGIVETMQDAVDSMTDSKDELEDIVDSIGSKGEHAEQQGDYAKEQGDYAKEQGDYAKEQGNAVSESVEHVNDAVQKVDESLAEMEDAMSELDLSTNNANTSAQYATEQGGYAKEQGDYAKSEADKVSQSVDEINSLKTDVEEATDELNILVGSSQYVGEWNKDTSYRKNNKVSYGGSSFISLQDDNIGNQPSSRSDTEYWGILSVRGVDGTGSVVSINGKSPNEDGDVELSPEDIGGISSSEKGVAGGVAKLDSEGSVLDGSGKVVEGKVKSVNDKIGDVTITANDLDVYTKEETDIKIADLVGSAPETLDTLHELADALGNDPDFATTVSNQIGKKINRDEAEDLISQAEQNAKEYTDEQISTIDVSNVEWDVINGKPTSSVEDIDDAVERSHEHLNEEVLNKVDEDENGNIVYDGKPIGSKSITLFEEYVATEDSTGIISISNSFSSVTDNLYVYYKGIRLEEGENYIVSSDNQSIELLDWSIDLNDEIELYIHKNIENVDNLVSGSQLIDGSIDKAKLSPSLQAEIESGNRSPDIKTVDKKKNQREGTILLNSSNIDGFFMQYGNDEATISREENITLHSPNSLKIDLNHGLDYEYVAVRNNDLRPFMMPETISVFVYIENTRNIIELEFYFSADYEYGQYVSKLYGGHQLVNGWNELIIHRDHFDNYVGDDALDSPRVSFQVRAEIYSEDDNKGVEIIFDSLRIRNKVRPKVLFTFDDGWLTQYTNAFPILLERGMVGNIGVVPTWISEYVDSEYNEPIMSFNQLKEMYDYGWDLFNHTYTHPNLENIPPSEAVNEVVMSKNWLNDNGFTRASDLFAYPYGGYRGVSQNPDFSKELRYGRTLVTGLSEGTFYNHTGGKTINMLKGMSPQTFKNYIDEAIRTGGDLVFCNHIVDNLDYDPWGMAYPIDQFTEVVDYLYEKRDEIDVVSLSEWVEDR